MELRYPNGIITAYCAEQFAAHLSDWGFPCIEIELSNYRFFQLQLPFFLQAFAADRSIVQTLSVALGYMINGETHQHPSAFKTFLFVWCTNESKQERLTNSFTMPRDLCIWPPQALRMRKTPCTLGTPRPRSQRCAVPKTILYDKNRSSKSVLLTMVCTMPQMY